MFIFVFLGRCSGSLNLLKNLLARLVPHISARRSVVRGQIADDGIRQCAKTREALAPQMHCDVPEKTLHQIHP